MNVRKTLAIGMVAVAGLFLSACGQDSPAPAQSNGSPAATGDTDGDLPRIGLVMKSLGNEFFQEMQQGALDYEAEEGTFELTAVGTQSETDIDGQVQAMNQLIAQQVDAIVIAPADSRGLVSPVQQAVEAGIPVINIDVRLDPDALEAAGIEVPFVGPDNREGAKLAGDALADAIGEGGRVVIIEGIPGVDNAEQRKAGFMDAIEDGGLELVASNTANWETDQAHSVLTSILTGDAEIDGVMTANDSMALGAISAVESAGLTGEIEIVGFDNIPAIHPYLEDGTVLATVDQYGSQQAALGIDAALLAIDGETLEPWVKTEVTLITGDAQ
ncbi:sugar ABC transporter substrate-binding protein [Georgenia wangjunii]|uniref:sugar ABC transporter substrate-binding protein n=1 Tax=Georgenia wangjunii TaxID=3117730 RepID=UPI002F26592D